MNNNPIIVIVIMVLLIACATTLLYSEDADKNMSDDDFSSGETDIKWNFFSDMTAVYENNSSSSFSSYTVDSYGATYSNGGALRTANYGQGKTSFRVWDSKINNKTYIVLTSPSGYTTFHTLETGSIFKIDGLENKK